MKNQLIAGLIAILTLSVFIHIRQLRSKQEQESRIDSLAKLSHKQTTIIRRYIAPDSTEHVVYKTVVVKGDSEKKLATAGYIDSLSKALDLKICQIQELKRVKASIRDSVKTVVKLDEVGNKQFSYANKWIDISLNTADSTLLYKYNVELVDTEYSKGILFWKKRFKDIHIADPNARITSLQTFETERQKRRFGIGLHVGYSYNIEQQRVAPVISAGLNYNLLSF